jgi:acyl-CoA synthetase (AMP-forming)/AMP-acid ligase II
MIADPVGGVARTSKRVMNLSHLLRQQAVRHPQGVALVWADIQWTWSELNARVDAMAIALAQKGVRKGDRVLVQSKNCNQLVESMFACFRVGAVWVPVNWRLTPADTANLAVSSGAVALICHADFPQHVVATCQAASSIRLIVAIGAATFGVAFDAVVARHLGQSANDASVEHDDPCWFFYTSGTTGSPKAAVLTHGQMAFVITNHIADLMPALSRHDVSLVVAPLSHGAGVHLLSQVARGAMTVLPAQERLDCEDAWALVEKWRVSNLFAVPTIVKLLTEHDAVDRRDHSSLRYLVYAGAPMYREDQKHAIKKLGRVLVQYFGLGEVTGNITVLPTEWHTAEDLPEFPIGSCGYERTGMRVAVLDSRGQEQKPGSTGEICACGPAVFPGYFNNPEANAKAFHDGWFRTGDLGHLDERGFLYITGRMSDMYISGGSNVYPREIEEQILCHPAIAEVAVLGVPDRQWGEIGVAIAVCRPGESCNQDVVLKFLEGKVARYKMPRQVFFWNELPKSAYGKVSKKALREVLAAR